MTKRYICHYCGHTWRTYSEDFTCPCCECSDIEELTQQSFRYDSKNDDGDERSIDIDRLVRAY